MGLNHSPKIVTDGLLLAMDAANKKSYTGSGTDIKNLQNSANDMVIYDGATFNSGGYFTFDGVANRIHGNSNFAKSLHWSANGAVGYQAMSFDVWIKTSDSAGYIVSKPWNGSGQYNYRIQPTRIDLVSGNTGTTSYGFSFDTSLATGTWKHMTCWVNSTQVGYYMDGGLYTKSAAHGLSGDIPTSGNENISLCIMSLFPYGTGWVGNTNFSQAGDLAALKMYNRVLTAAEANQNFNALRGRFGL